jgi:hypothetical protein
MLLDKLDEFYGLLSNTRLPSMSMCERDLNESLRVNLKNRPPGPQPGGHRHFRVL